MTIRILALSVFFIFISACEDKPVDNNIDEKHFGTAAGVVLLNDTLWDKLASHDGVNVSIDGSSLSAITDSLGNWSISGISPGSNRFVFSKEGFGVFKSYEVIEADKINKINVELYPSYFTFYIDSLKARTSGDNIMLSFKSMPESNELSGSSEIFLFVSDKPGITPESYPIGFPIAKWYDYKRSYGYFFPASYLYIDNIQKGDSVYMAAYIIAAKNYNSYYDSLSQRDIFPCLSKKSNEVGIILP